jgi:beta-glucosidase
VEIRYVKGCDNWQEPPALGPDMLLPFEETGQVLKVDFYNNPILEGEPVDQIFAPKADLWMWANSLPATHVTSRRFSLRANGRLKVEESGEYTLNMNNSATSRVYLDGKLINEHTTQPTSIADGWEPMRSSVNLVLESGKIYALQIDFSKDNDDPFALARVSLSRSFHTGEDNRIQRAVDLAKAADVAIIFAGMPVGFESEGADRPHMRLPGPQDELIQKVVQANPKTIVVLNAGSPVEMPWADQIPAIVEAYYPGQEGGHAVARVLLGEVNPSGKLTVTFPKRLEDTPAFINYPGGKQVNYGEGIFVGYRYYETKQVEPLFPFGHGLSYTTFEYSNLIVPAKVKSGETVEVSLIVMNTGSQQGKEVIQCYVADKVASLVRPPKELKAFAKVDLKPGETETVKFSLDMRSFAYYDPYAAKWTAEPGEFDILVGSSSQDIRLTAGLTLA